MSLKWKNEFLGKIATLQRGFDLPLRFRRLGPIPIITSSGTEDTHSEAKVKGPGVVTGRYGTIGEVFFVRGDFWPLNTTLYVRDFHENDPLFVSYLLRTIDFHTHSGKSGVPGVNRNDLHEVLVPVPPTRAEQEAIAEALSDADALIESMEQLLAKKRQIKQGAMQELLTGKRRLAGFRGAWNGYRFDQLFDVLRTANNSRDELSENGEVAYLHYGDIHTHPTAFLDPTSEQTYISRAKVKTIPRLVDGDLVMADASEDTAAIGKAVEIVGLNGREAVAGLHTMLLRADKHVVADGFKGYLQYFPSVRSALVRLATGVSVYGITKSGVKAIEIVIPKPDEQTAIATILSDMDAEIAALEIKLNKARKIKQHSPQHRPGQKAPRVPRIYRRPRNDSLA